MIAIVWCSSIPVPATSTWTRLRRTGVWMPSLRLAFQRRAPSEALSGRIRVKRRFAIITCAIFDAVSLTLRHAFFAIGLALLVFCSLNLRAQKQATYLGMDRNDYPGDASMASLRKTFAF